MGDEQVGFSRDVASNYGVDSPVAETEGGVDVVPFSSQDFLAV